MMAITAARGQPCRSARRPSGRPPPPSWRWRPRSRPPSPLRRTTFRRTYRGGEADPRDRRGPACLSPHRGPRKRPGRLFDGGCPARWVRPRARLHGRQSGAHISAMASAARPHAVRTSPARRRRRRAARVDLARAQDRTFHGRAGLARHRQHPRRAGPHGAARRTRSSSATATPTSCPVPTHPYSSTRRTTGLRQCRPDRPAERAGGTSATRTRTHRRASGAAPGSATSSGPIACSSTADPVTLPNGLRRITAAILFHPPRMPAWISDPRVIEAMPRHMHPNDVRFVTFRNDGDGWRPETYPFSTVTVGRIHLLEAGPR